MLNFQGVILRVFVGVSIYPVDSVGVCPGPLSRFKLRIGNGNMSIYCTLPIRYPFEYRYINLIMPHQPTCETICSIAINIYPILASWWFQFNPSERNMLVKLDHFPHFFFLGGGAEHKKKVMNSEISVWNHHLFQLVLFPHLPLIPW